VSDDGGASVDGVGDDGGGGGERDGGGEREGACGRAGECRARTRGCWLDVGIITVLPSAQCSLFTRDRGKSCAVFTRRDVPCACELLGGLGDAPLDGLDGPLGVGQRGGRFLLDGALAAGAALVEWRDARVGGELGVGSEVFVEQDLELRLLQSVRAAVNPLAMHPGTWRRGMRRAEREGGKSHFRPRSEESSSSCALRIFCRKLDEDIVFARMV